MHTLIEDNTKSKRTLQPIYAGNGKSTQKPPTTHNGWNKRSILAHALYSLHLRCKICGFKNKHELMTKLVVLINFCIPPSSSIKTKIISG
ncbi:unnamed protein product [Brassica rapa subsp. trilocularis]